MRKNGILLFNRKKEIFTINKNIIILLNSEDIIDNILISLYDKIGLEIKKEEHEIINLGDYNNIRVYAIEYNNETIKLNIKHKWLNLYNCEKIINNEEEEFFNRIKKYLGGSKITKSNKLNDFFNMSIHEKKDFYQNFLKESIGVNKSVKKATEMIYSIIETEIFLFFINLESNTYYKKHMKKQYEKETLFLNKKIKINDVYNNIDIDFIDKILIDLNITIIDLNDFDFSKDLSNASFDIIEKNLFLDLYLPKDFLFEYKTEENFKKFIIKYFNNFLESIVSHELTHALEFSEKIKKYGTFITKDLLMNLFNEEISEQPISYFSIQWYEFLKLIYLNISFEVNARVTQIYYQIKNQEIKNQDDFWYEIKKTYIWNEMIELKNFNSNNFYNELKFEIPENYHDDNIKEIFNNNEEEEIKKLMLYGLLSSWNKIIDLVNDEYKDDNIKLDKLPESFLDSPKKFFEFYEKKFHETWEYFYTKISKLITHFI